MQFNNAKPISETYLMSLSTQLLYTDLIDGKLPFPLEFKLCDYL